MTEKEFLAGISAPSIRVERSERDLSIVGWNEPRVMLESNEEPKLEILEQGIVISAVDNLSLMVPFNAKVEVVWAGADLMVRDIKSAVVVRQCMGDLLLRHCESADLGTVNGGLTVRDLGGDLNAQSVAGDAKLRHVLGEIVLEAGGDVRMDQPASRVQIRAGGDASVAVLPKPGSENSVVAHGDLRCYLPPGASVVVDGKAGGDTFVRQLSGGKGPQPPLGDGSLPVTFGKGEARLKVEASGDLWIGGWINIDSWGEWRELGHDMGQMGMEFGMLAGEFGRWVERNMHDKFDEYDKRLRRKMEEGKFARDHRRYSWNATPPRPPSPPSPAGAGESERLSILDMLQKGKITVDEAERLLTALEKNG